MLDPANVPSVDPQEMTTRFIIDKRHVYQETHTVKPNAFMPKPYVEQSVTRLIEITEEEVWAVGRAVASARKPARTLRGRGDVLAAT